MPTRVEVEVREAEATSSRSGWVEGDGIWSPSTFKLDETFPFHLPPHAKSLFLVSESEYGHPNELPDIEQISLFQFVEVMLDTLSTELTEISGQQ